MKLTREQVLEVLDKTVSASMRDVRTTVLELYDEVERLKRAAVNLRTAQRSYMADRGNHDKGRAVAAAATEMDAALAYTGEQP